MTDMVKEGFFSLCKKVDTPKSLGLWLQYSYAQDELARASITPLAYNDAEAFFADYACVSFLRKYEGLITGIDTASVALLAFDKAEEQCRLTNEKLRSYATTGQVDQIEPSILLKAQELIASVWGQPSFEEMFRCCGWGPGATCTLKGDSATTEDKMSELPMSVTPTALPYLRAVQKYDRLWLGHLIGVEVDGPASLLPQCYNQIDYSRLLTVPKDAKTDRTIAAEPTGNIFLQKGIGGYLRKRLRVHGINLDDQSRNQRLAELAHHCHLATLDMSAASDTVSIGLCKVLLPPDMFKTLDDLRAPAFRYAGSSSRRFHKISSMGNGFTFELETLIFWALAKAVQYTASVRGPIGVYGDDIIVPQLIAQDVISVLESCGFTINKEKSFVDGRFFESCGKHYFDGVDVTPVYQKRLVDNDLEICRYVNRVYELAFCRPYLGAEKRFGKVHSRLLSLLSKDLLKYKGPGWAEGDGFFRVVNYTGKMNLSSGYRITYMATRRPKEKLADGGLYAYAMRKHDTREDDPLLPRGNGVLIAERLSDFAREISTERLRDFAAHGKVTIRPKNRVVTYRRATRWVPLR